MRKACTLINLPAGSSPHIGQNETSTGDSCFPWLRRRDSRHGERRARRDTITGMMELYQGRSCPGMELDLESGLEIKVGEADPEAAEPFEAVMCCADASLLVLCCILFTVAVAAFGNMPFQPGLALTAVAGTIFVVLVLAITAARDKYIGKHVADNVGASN